VSHISQPTSIFTNTAYQDDFNYGDDVFYFVYYKYSNDVFYSVYYKYPKTISTTATASSQLR
jgi:hypothetical protein